MTLSVVIVSYNVKDFLEQCLCSVQKAMRNIDGEIFVVDNASVDGTQSMLKAKFSLPNVHLIFNEKNLGFAKANNQALRLCNGRFVLVLNPDTLLQEDTLEKMIAFMETDSSIGAAGCKVLNADGSFQLSCRRSFPSPEVSFYKIVGLSALFPKSRRFARYNLTYLSTEETYEVDALMGAFMFLRREVLETVGLFDEAFFMYGEDLDWCYRIKRAGWKIYYYPGTQIIHYKGESAKKMSFNYVIQFYEAMLIFARKYYSSSKWFEAILIVGICARASLAFLRRALVRLHAPLLDALCVAVACLIGFKWKFKEYPEAFLEIALPVYVAVQTAAFASFGQYREGYRYSLKKLFPALLVGFALSSTFNFFFKAVAFSRAGLGFSYLTLFGLAFGWRIVARLIVQRSFSGAFEPRKRVAIVGADEFSQSVAEKLAREVGKNYDIVGFIETRESEASRLPAGSVLGKMENIGEIARVNRLDELVFVSPSLTNADVLSAITRCDGRAMDFKIVPQGMDVMIGKGAIDELASSVPLADVEFNLSRKSRQLGKRLFDLAILPLMAALSPAMHLAGRKEIFRSLWDVLKGEKTWIGAAESIDGYSKSGVFVGKAGVWSLWSIQKNRSVDKETLDIFYAKNSSLGLDIELLAKALFR
ncbi:MAG: glycosyltransferase [Chloroherpetonaceae bacterium]|nr:glycosyltransferase [Chloroherpetonaceae bacterium]MDW8437732.1 glycosyltransferase [Chloroherpetonaceae bacterium]